MCPGFCNPQNNNNNKKQPKQQRQHSHVQSLVNPIWYVFFCIWSVTWARGVCNFKENKTKKIVNKVRRLGSFSAFLTEYSILLLLALHDKTLMALLAYFLYLYTVHTEWGDFLTPLLTLGLLFIFVPLSCFHLATLKIHSISQTPPNRTLPEVVHKSGNESVSLMRILFLFA